MLKRKFSYSEALLLLLLLILSFNFLNGVVILVSGADLKLTYIKILLTLFFLFKLLTDKKTILLPVVFMVLTIFFVLVHSQVSKNYNVVEDISNFIKLLMPLITFLAFYIFNKRGFFDKPLIMKFLSYFFKFALLLILLNSYLIFSGISIYQYQFSDSSVGGGGLISSGNELAALLVLLYLPSLSFIYISNLGRFWLLFCVLVYGFAMFVGGMKFAILSFIILTIYYFTYVQKFNLKSLLYGLLIFLALPFVIGKVFQLIEPFIARWEYFYNQFDLLTFLLSGRNIRIEYFFNEILDNISLLEFIFGFGWGTDSNIGFIGYGVYEVDFFDALYSYGLIGLIISLIIWGGGVILSIVYLFKSKNLFTKSASLSVILLFSGSFITGHIWFSGLIGVYLGTLFFFTILLKDQTDESFSIH
ncbi:O-antigen ligase family protein [Vibrio vulnificus]|uniref:O-antigen ligase family protein n=1 Tax=Vibrio vulnificus TaxID=672 RepID=UPI001FADD08D|nr:O-antigen ligase family protein [Vibrio vulnificus]MCJ0821971.1 O-antigen ligase family protein [Vibrio vulnificus]